MLLQLLHVTQIALVAYGGQHAYVAIRNLRKYEEKSEKAAQYSSEAARQLRTTRTTMALGAVTLLVSGLAALLLAARGPRYDTMRRALVSPVLLIITDLARNYIQSYWAGGNGTSVGTRVPLPKMGDYNEAQRRIEKLLACLGWLVLAWGATSLVELASAIQLLWTS